LSFLFVRHALWKRGETSLGRLWISIKSLENEKFWLVYLLIVKVPVDNRLHSFCEIIVSFLDIWISEWVKVHYTRVTKGASSSVSSSSFSDWWKEESKRKKLGDNLTDGIVLDISISWTKNGLSAHVYSKRSFKKHLVKFRLKLFNFFTWRAFFKWWISWIKWVNKIFNLRFHIWEHSFFAMNRKFNLIFFHQAQKYFLKIDNDSFSDCWCKLRGLNFVCDSTHE